MGCSDALPPWKDPGDDIRRLTYKETPFRKSIGNSGFINWYKETCYVLYHSSTILRAIIDIQDLYTCCLNTEAPIYSP